MNEKFEFEPVAQEPIVYVRPVAVADLPGEVLKKIYAENAKKLLGLK